MLIVSYSWFELVLDLVNEVLLTSVGVILDELKKKIASS